MGSLNESEHNMGIRIQKDIGYFLNNENIKKVLVDDYDAILEEMRDNEEWEKEFFSSLVGVAKEVLSEDGLLLANYQLKSLEKEYNDKKIHFYQLIDNVLFGDDSQGLLFKTESMVKSSRRDDNIDYYENPKVENYINYLKRPIYPNMGYVYHGGLEDYDMYPKLEKGQTYYEHIGHIARMINRHIYQQENDLDSTEDVSKIMTEKGFFTPTIDETIYVLARACNILKPEVTQSEFNKLLEPAIVTSWS